MNAEWGVSNCLMIQCFAGLYFSFCPSSCALLSVLLLNYTPVTHAYADFSSTLGVSAAGSVGVTGAAVEEGVD